MEMVSTAPRASKGFSAAVVKTEVTAPPEVTAETAVRLLAMAATVAQVALADMVVPVQPEFTVYSQVLMAKTVASEVTVAMAA